MTSSPAEPDLNRRIFRDSAIACALLAVAALAVWPRSWAAAGGVMAGGALMGASAWAIHAAVDGVLGAERKGKRGPWVLVKFFTRHAILAAAAYGIMVRLHLDPVGMLVGVSSLVLAAGVEVIRRLQRVS
jgi:hypothetical protein